jgi:uncharacterized membrane protein
MENNSQTVTLKLEKGYIAAIAIVLVVVSCVTAGYFILYPAKSSGYNEMYLLDGQNQAVDYPQVLVVNQNSSFNQQVTVVNHMPDEENYYQLQVKIVEDTVGFPVNAPAVKTVEFPLKWEESWSSQVPISINEPGSYSVVFELYMENKYGTSYVFTNNFCVLHIDVVSAAV